MEEDPDLAAAIAGPTFFSAQILTALNIDSFLPRIPFTGDDRVSSTSTLLPKSLCSQYGSFVGRNPDLVGPARAC